MDAENKRSIMIGIVVVCLIAAGGITFFRLRGGAGGDIPKGEMMWAKCVNPNCNAECEVDMREFYAEATKSRSNTPKCKQCGEESLYDAIKCEKCGIVFVPGSVRSEVRDRCPECGYSKIKGDTKPVK